ncbi:MAG: hypothetical protein NDJ19_06540 [Ramlibacter sp.]|nr:hypothetical protein [Ramlibacter sp.]
MELVEPMTERKPSPQALKSRLLADLERAVSAGHVLQATTVAVLIGRNACDLVDQCTEIPGVRSGSVDERLQSHLRNIVTLLAVAERHFGDVVLAVQWYVAGHPADAAQQTPESLAAAGRLEDAYRLLPRTSSRFKPS